MKKILLIGSAYAEIISEVETLPKGNEAFHPIQQTECISGDAYRMEKLISALGFENQLIVTVGEGVYGELVRNTLRDCGIEVAYTYSGLNGCTYHLKDFSGKESFITVPGEEFEFHIENLEDVYPEEFGAVIVCDEVLESENVDELLSALEDMELPIYLNGTGKLTSLDPIVRDALFSLHPVVMLSDTDSYELNEGKTTDLKDASLRIREKTENDVLLYQKETGVYMNVGDETYIAPSEKILNQTFYFAAYVVARNCGIDKKNALMFASEVGTLKSLDQLTAFEVARMKRMLADKIW